MKTIRRTRPLSLIAAATALLLGAFSASAQYQLTPQQPNFYRSDTNTAGFSLTNLQGMVVATNRTPLKLTVRQDKGLSVFASITTTQSLAFATNFLGQFWFNVSPDGTNFTSAPAGSSPLGSPPLLWQPSLWCVSSAVNSGVYTNIVWTNFPATVLNNLRAIQLNSITNVFTNGCLINWLYYSYSGQ